LDPRKKSCDSERGEIFGKPPWMLQLPLLKPDRFLAATSFHTLYGALDEDWLTKIVNKL
jgi:hypothetical protein